MAIDDPYNQMPGPTYKQYAIIGEEERYHINLGTQLSFFNGESSNAYFSFFANLNNVRLKRNYIVINTPFFTSMNIRVSGWVEWLMAVVAVWDLNLK